VQEAGSQEALVAQAPQEVQEEGEPTARVADYRFGREAVVLLCMESGGFGMADSNSPTASIRFIDPEAL
jgi:hypothetical protein